MMDLKQPLIKYYKAFNTAKNQKYDRYQESHASNESLLLILLAVLLKIKLC